MRGFLVSEGRRHAIALVGKNGIPIVQTHSSFDSRSLHPRHTAIVGCFCLLGLAVSRRFIHRYRACQYPVPMSSSRPSLQSHGWKHGNWCQAADRCQYFAAARPLGFEKVSPGFHVGKRRKETLDRVARQGDQHGKHWRGLCVLAYLPILPYFARMHNP